MRNRRSPPNSRFPALTLAALLLVLTRGCSLGAATDGTDRAATERADRAAEPALLASLLASLGDDPAETIRGAFDRTDADRRQASLREAAASAYGDRPAMLPLYRLLLTDPDAAVRSAAVSALSRHGGAEDAVPVAGQLASSDAFLRWEAAKALRYLPDEATVDPLLDRLLNDEDAGTRVAAAEALGRYPRRDVFEALRVSLVDADYALVAASAGSLATLTGRDLGTSPEAWGRLAAERGGTLFADARPYEPRGYREPPGFFGRMLGR